MSRTNNIIIVSILLFSCIGCDQASKQIAKSALEYATPQSLFNDFLRLQYAENPGGMMSFGAELHPVVRFWFLTVFVGVMLTGILAFAVFSSKLTRLQVASLTMIAGGGFSNLIDRLLNEGHVIDFLNVGLGTLRTAIFNLADVVILLGALLLLLSSSFQKEEHRPTTPIP